MNACIKLGLAALVSTTVCNTLANGCDSHELSSLRVGLHGELFVAGSFGKSFSLDGGKNWTEGDNGNEASFEPEANRDKGGRIYACSPDGQQLVATNDGKAWIQTQAPDTPAPGEGVEIILNGNHASTSMHYEIGLDGKKRKSNAIALYMGPRSPECAKAYVYRDIIYVLSEKAIYKSRDHGKTLERLPIGKTSENRGDLQYGAADSIWGRIFEDSKGRLYMNAYDQSYHFRIYKSIDQGKHWSPIHFSGLDGSSLQDSIMLMRISNDTLYFLAAPSWDDHEKTIWSGELYRSDIHGAATGLNLDIQSAGGLEEFHVGPQGILYVLGRQALYKSIDNGKTWETFEGQHMTSQKWLQCGPGMPDRTLTIPAQAPGE